MITIDYPFTVSLNRDIQVTSTEDYYTLQVTESDPSAWLTFATTPAMDMAFDHLKAGTTTESLVQTLAELGGPAAREQFALTLQQLDERGWLSYAVLPLAEAIPMVESAELNLPGNPHWMETGVTLSRFAYQHPYEGTMVLESPLSKFRVKLLDWRASALLAQLAQPQTLGTIAPPPYLGPETAYQFLNLLWATGFLASDHEPVSLQLWDFHNLLFHSRSRLGRHDYPGTDLNVDNWSDFPVVKPPMSDRIVPLPRPNLEALMSNDATLTEAIETRKSVREYDDDNPITIEQLGELLYRAARVTKLLSPEERFGKLWQQNKPVFEEAGVDEGEFSHRPYPGGGAMYELEIYPVVRLCQGLSQGVYHYDPLNHQLEQIVESKDDIFAVSGSPLASKLGPHVLLVITARFGRLFRLYRSVAYALVLKHVGVLQQNLYLVATNMGLAPCAGGAGDSDAFAQVTGIDYVEESAVGEFILGSLASEVESDVVEGEDEIESAGVSASEVESSATKQKVALHPHDLDERIPGLADLHNQTLGDPQITIVIIDGDPDYTLSCFEGAEVSKVFPYWHEPAEPITPEDYAAFQSIRDQGLKGKEKEEALEAVIPDTKDRIVLNDHACHVTSTIVGQEHSPVFGIAPNCRVINMPQDAVIRGNYDDVMSPLNLARAIDLALELGANIIHCAFCRPTQTSEGEEILVQAIKKCQDNNVLIVSPTGNNSNESWCLPAVLPGTLAVGAAKVDGTPCHFSNWGGNNTKEGILAPGEEILGAQPCTEEPVRLTGTSMAAPVMTGISALLMSLQVQQGKPVDAEAVRTALLKTAIPCDPEVVEEPERCLRGFVNIPGAMKVLFGQPSVTVSFAGGQATRTEHPGYATVAPASIPEPMAERATPAVQAATATEMVIAPSTEPANPATVEASTAFSGNVYALGTIGYDFGDEARRDTFKERMADPYDARQMVEHLDRNPDEARSLIWTLNLEGDVIYALDPKGPFATNVYEIFLQMLAGQLEPETSADFIERLSVPARRTTRTVELFSGEVMPVVNVRDPRGMYGWNVNALVDAALATVEYEEADEDSLRQGLTAFLNRVYHDLHNLGQTSRDRALNFTVTNTFQAASTFAQAIASGRQLDTIEVNKSPYCRLNSDCWDVLLTFYDPEHGRRSRRVFRFTLDVVYVLPVTVGSIKSWSLPGKGTVSK